ncbi:MAG: DNA topoisomerase IV subunit A [bacterium]
MQSLQPLMDQNFLEYASYVIKDRAIPDIGDGLKPVQRRILHTMWKMDDGKFNKVANVVGETMKLHPHGDASIGSALVVMANKEYFIEKQGNFGNLFTGDPASAARYIEARLTPLAKEILFNPDLTEFIESYDGRNQEPVLLPCKIPATLLLGAEGIAVGMSTRILPHNFNEVLEAQIACLNGEELPVLCPDFLTGGILDAEQYQDGNGKIRVRARVEVQDEKTLVIRDVPYGVTTESLIQSIQDAANKGKLKLASINDYTTEEVAVELRAMRGVKAESLLKPLYAFTQCEVSVSINLLVIRDNQPVLMTVTEVVEHSTKRLLTLLELELKLELEQLRHKWHRGQLEVYFLQERLYQLLEQCDSYEEVLERVEAALQPLQPKLDLPITKEDLEALLSIPIKRISRFDQKQAEANLKKLQKSIREVRKHLRELRPYAVSYLQGLKERYGELYPRRTEVESFEEVRKRDVAEAVEVGWDKQSGFIGTSVKSNHTLSCSSVDKLVLFRKDGRYQVIKVPEKLFVGKDVMRMELLDTKATYNLIYAEGESQVCFAKRFRVEKFILEKEYRLFTKARGAKVLHLSAGPGVMLEALFVPTPRLRKTRELVLFDSLLVKGAQARGNRVSDKPIDKIRQLAAQNLESPQLGFPDSQS